MVRLVRERDRDESLVNDEHRFPSFEQFQPQILAPLRIQHAEIDQENAAGRSAFRQFQQSRLRRGRGGHADPPGALRKAAELRKQQRLGIHRRQRDLRVEHVDLLLHLSEDLVGVELRHFEQQLRDDGLERIPHLRTRSRLHMALQSGQ